MPLQEGQILETEEYSFVLVRADKNSKELIAVQMDILLGQGTPAVGHDNDDDLYLRNAIDISNVTSEDLLKTGNLDLESLNNPTLITGATDALINPAEIDSLAKDLIDDVISSAAPDNSSCMIDISNFTAKDFFSSQNFNFDTEFESPGKIDLKYVKMPIQVEQGQKFVVIEPASVVAKSPPATSTPIIERRMPKFNKRTKVIHELREFEAKLQNISILEINREKLQNRKRKQDFKKIIDFDTSFYSDEETKNLKVKKPRAIRKKLKVDKSVTIETVSETESEDSVKVVVMDKESDDDSNSNQGMSLRCNYCQKMFITVSGLNTHIKQCPKLEIKLNELIEECCYSPKNKIQEMEVTAAIPTNPNSIEPSKTITTTPVRKNIGRPRKKLL